MNPPPSETGANVIQFNLTEGCNHGVCTFCEMYGQGRFRVKEIDDYKEHVDLVVRYLAKTGTISKIGRVFLGAGNALCVDTKTLLYTTQYTLKKLKDYSGIIPRRLAIYGNTHDILNQGRDGLSELRCGGTCSTGCSIRTLGDRRGVEVVYWGLESGDSQVLKIAGKGCDEAQVGKAAETLRNSRIRPSIMVMPGLGGIRYFDGHVTNTTRILNMVHPEWITFMGLKIGENTPYNKWIKNEEDGNRNRRLTDNEIVQQTAEIIDRLKIHTKVGIHGPEVHGGIKYNPVPLGVTEISDNYDARELAERLRENIGLSYSTYA